MLSLLIIILPLLNIFVIGIFGNKLGKTSVKFITTFNIGLALILVINLYILIIKGYFFYINIGVWLNLDLFFIRWGFIFDSISVSMLVLIFFVSFFVHIYSFEYMSIDPHFMRFIGILSLFTFFMALLISSDNLVLLFFGWEGVGVCSYLLINFWFTRLLANKAAMKAVFINKIGDLSIILGILLIFYTFNTFDFLILSGLVPFFYKKTFFFFGFNFKILNLISWFLLIGSVSKSAQLILHVWLPDAMEGPTPVSALIHAATMVTIGIFLILRMSFLFEYAPDILNILMLWGSLTAFFSAFISCFQLDIKKIIAYSTCSQLGYMFSVCGLSGYNLSLFHLINHAFFKALLFLSAGMLIHSLLNEQDIRRMGSLVKILPVTFTFFFLGSLALMGLPFLSGFYSKDLIIELFFIQFSVSSVFSYWLLIFSALLTVIYSFRLIYFVFLNKRNFHSNFYYKIIYSKALESNLYLIIPLSGFVFGSIFSGYLLQDLIVGQGSEFFRFSLYILPKNELYSQIEHTPFFFKQLPIFFSLLGYFILLNSFLILNKINNFFSFKRIYNLFIYKLYFDEIYNNICLYILFPLGKFFIVSLDNGLLELCGPRGLLKILLACTFRFHSYLDKFLYNYFNLYFFFIWLLIFIFEFFY